MKRKNKSVNNEVTKPELVENYYLSNDYYELMSLFIKIREQTNKPISLQMRPKVPIQN